MDRRSLAFNSHSAEQVQAVVGLDASLDRFTVTRDSHDFVSGKCFGPVFSAAERWGVGSSGVVVEVEAVAFEAGRAA